MRHVNHADSVKRLVCVCLSESDGFTCLEISYHSECGVIFCVSLLSPKVLHYRSPRNALLKDPHACQRQSAAGNQHCVTPQNTFLVGLSHRRHSYTTWTTPESKIHKCRRFVSHNSASISPWRVEYEEVNQKKSHRRTGNQMAHMVILPVSCQQHMKLYAS